MARKAKLGNFGLRILLVGAVLFVAAALFLCAPAKADVGGGINLYRDGMNLSASSSSTNDGWSYIDADVSSALPDVCLDRANVWYSESQPWPDGSVPFFFNFELGGQFGMPMNTDDSWWSSGIGDVQVSSGLSYWEWQDGGVEFSFSGAHASAWFPFEVTWDSPLRPDYQKWTKGDEAYFSWSGWVSGHYLPGDGNLPEPASAALLGLGGTFLIRRRR